MTTFPLRRLHLRSGEERHDHVSIQLEPFELGGERYLPVPDAVAADLAIQRATGGDMFRLRFQVRLHGPCMRCLEDAVVDRPIEVSEYHEPGAADDELRSDYVADELLHLSAWARDAISFALPDQILCRPECAGLCPLCGRNLNLEPHEHEDEPGDTRWSVLEELRQSLE
ncbi:MAG TPA: DUF177 domain-containing protein [Gaiella sp.]|jgi:uncharacterized protein